MEIVTLTVLTNVIISLGSFVAKLYLSPSYGQSYHRKAQGMNNEQKLEAALKEISELKAALKQTQSELTSNRLAAIVDSSDDAIISKDLNSIVTTWNTGAEKIFGYSAAEMIGTSIMRLIPTERQDEEIHILGKIKRGENVEHFETLRQTKDERLIDVSVTASPIRDVNGKVIGASKVARDITQRKQAEAARLASETRFKELAENINEVFWMTDPTGHEMLYVSPVFEKIWGRTCESLYADPQSWLHAIHPEDQGRVMKSWLGATQTDNREPVPQEATARKPDYEEEYRIVRPDKSVRWIHDRGFIIRNQTGQMQRVVGVTRDITENRKLEAQFRQSQKMEGIGQLAGGVAHDFNNILAIIEMQSGLLKSSGGLSADQSEYADEISVTVQRAATLTRQLLLFSRREVFQPRDLDLSESITNTTKMLRRILGENVQIQLKLASQPMFIHADAGMMDQVLLNLAVNARDAMPNGGQLVIETSGVEFDEFAVSQAPQARPGSFVRLNVSDSGCGIPPEILPKIFEPFFTTKDIGKGTGLGLATVFGIVQQHQGWINVYSEVNHGTTFRVYLPRLAKNAGQKSSQPALTATSGGNETILLAEDDPSLRVSVRKTLSQLGYRILEAPTGVKALEVWKENRSEIRLLLTDLVMPDGMTGKDLAQRILQDNPKLKVIYMSGYSAEVGGKDFPLKEGVNFLTKPFQASKLAQTIRDSLDKST
jgi:PAS domain S-box-containing protein